MKVIPPASVPTFHGFVTTELGQLPFRKLPLAASYGTRPCDLRPPSPFSSPQGEDITLHVSGFAKMPAPVQLQIDDEKRGPFLLLLGEKAGMRAGV